VATTAPRPRLHHHRLFNSDCGESLSASGSGGGSRFDGGGDPEEIIRKTLRASPGHAELDIQDKDDGDESPPLPDDTPAAEHRREAAAAVNPADRWGRRLARQENDRRSAARGGQHRARQQVGQREQADGEQQILRTLGGDFPRNCQPDAPEEDDDGSRSKLRQERQSGVPSGLPLVIGISSAPSRWHRRPSRSPPPATTDPGISGIQLTPVKGRYGNSRPGFPFEDYIKLLHLKG
jgi:hypothetical protein